MTTTTATDSAGLSVYNPVANVGVGKSEMGQQDFLRLLTAQMQTQDPFEPVNNIFLLRSVPIQWKALRNSRANILDSSPPCA